MTPRRTLLSRLWLLGSVAYGGVRALLVWRFLSGYGVNPWGFAAVELGSSALYGWASARVVLAVVDRSWGLLWRVGPLAVGTYAAPDIFVFATLGHAPDGLVRTLVGIVGVSALLAAVALVREVRRRRAAATEAHPGRSDAELPGGVQRT